jgi:4-diphosphocytidyl-2-C-methyl-D-erythritol kinase
VSAVREARVEAQAKLNLVLRVLGREATGYHRIETLFCRIALSDSVLVRATPSGRSIECRGPRVPSGGLGSPEKNLAYRAAVSYAGVTGFPAGFSIAVEKRIPVGGGLGGGSADAGAVLRALNALNPRPLAAPELLGIASSLGADVPFLTQDESAMAIGRGYGDRLEVVPALPSRAVWLLVPDAGVSTADAYRWLDASARPTPTAPMTRDHLGNWEQVAARASNDFESVVGVSVPLVGRLLRALRGGEMEAVLGPEAIVLMSGSGSTVAVISGERPRANSSPFPAIDGVDIVETETSTFVEPVVLTH